jgi:hypothetical protein
MWPIFFFLWPLFVNTNLPCLTFTGFLESMGWILSTVLRNFQLQLFKYCLLFSPCFFLLLGFYTITPFFSFLYLFHHLCCWVFLFVFQGLLVQSSSSSTVSRAFSTNCTTHFDTK